MKQVINITDLSVTCIIGILPHERQSEQELLVSAWITGDWSASFSSENIEDTLDYTQISDEITSTLIEAKYQLIETAANKCANNILSRADVSQVRILIKKPMAIKSSKYVSFDIILP